MDESGGLPGMDSGKLSVNSDGVNYHGFPFVKFFIFQT